MKKVLKQNDDTNSWHKVMTQNDGLKWWHKVMTQSDETNNTKRSHKKMKQSQYKNCDDRTCWNKLF
jgi:hypothetical protein